MLLYCLAAPVHAQDELKNMISAYNGHDYAKAAQLAEDIVKKEPKNAEARYYLGNSYVELHQLEQAKVQYKRCLELSPNSEISRDSNTALQHLSQYAKATKDQQLYGNSMHGSYGPGQNHGSNGSSQNQSTYSSAQNQGDPNAEEEQRIKDEANERIRMKEDDAHRAIQRIQERKSDDIASMPGRHSGRGSGYFKAGKEEVNADAQQKIDQIKRTLAKDKRDIMKDAKRSLSGLRR